MKLIIGLGNIGKEYEKTRHNVGFLCLDRFASLNNLEIKETTKFSFFKYRNAVLIMPKTYMNRSGEAFQSALSKYQEFEDVLVVMDDIELPIGKIRIRKSGGDGGHNGLKSILEKAGTKDIRRIRVGIGRPSIKTAKDYVLDTFTSEEMMIIDSELNLISEWLNIYIRYDLKRLLDEFSIWKKKPIPSAEDGINRPKEEMND